MSVQTQEARIILALEAIRSSKKISIRRAAAIYNVPRVTLADRINGRTAIADRRPKIQKLTEAEEKALVQYILELDSTGFPPRIAGVGEMANYLLRSRRGQPVGKHWVHRFIERQPEIKTRMSRAYDFQRALCEDPDVLNAWFRMVGEMRTKYSIQDGDFYNFDETGFAMGLITPTLVVTRADRRGKGKSVQPGNKEWATAIICCNAEGWTLPPFLVVKGEYHLSNWYTETDLPRNWVIKPTSNGWTNNETGLEWIQHFHKHTASRAKGVYRMLVVDGHESHLSAEFQIFCKSHNIITLSMPSHSSHLTQPLDVGCFSVLKRSYGDQINGLVKAHVNHITKVEFFIAFKAAYLETMTEKNIKGGFRGSGLVPFDPQAVISKLDVKLQTPTPTRPPLPANDAWVSQTPQNPTEAVSQSEYVKKRISYHLGSSPTTTYEAARQLADGVTMIVHKVTLLQEEIRALRRSNEALSKRRRAKKTRVRQGGAITVEAATDLISQKDAVVQAEQDRRQNRGAGSKRAVGERRCGTCGGTGHNARTCEKDIETSEESDYE
jgi:hypothetical protein